MIPCLDTTLLAGFKSLQQIDRALWYAVAVVINWCCSCCLWITVEKERKTHNSSMTINTCNSSYCNHPLLFDNVLKMLNWSMSASLSYTSNHLQCFLTLLQYQFHSAPWTTHFNYYRMFLGVCFRWFWWEARRVFQSFNSFSKIGSLQLNLRTVYRQRKLLLLEQPKR